MRNDILLVEDRPDLVKDKYSKAVKNNDGDALAAYKRKRAFRRKTQDLPERMEKLESKMNLIMEKLDRLIGE